MWLESSQAWKQIEDGHLDQRVFTSLVFQHPPTHLVKELQKTKTKKQTNKQLGHLCLIWQWPCVVHLVTLFLNIFTNKLQICGSITLI